jgi:hypothetical protein
VQEAEALERGELLATVHQRVYVVNARPTTGAWRIEVDGLAASLARSAGALD